MIDILNNYIKILFFISAYSPLFIILAIRNIDDSSLLNFNNYLACFLILISLISLWFVKFFLDQQQEIQPEQFEIVEIEDKTGELSTYILTYLVPFLTINLHSKKDIFSLLIFIYIIGLIYVNSNMIYINPVIMIFKHKILELRVKKDDTEKRIIIIIPNEAKFLRTGTFIRCSIVNTHYKDIYFYNSTVQ